MTNREAGRTGSLAKLTRGISLTKNFQQKSLCQYRGVGLCQLRGLASQQTDDVHHAARGCERPLELAALEAGLNSLSGFWSGVLRKMLSSCRCKSCNTSVQLGGFTVCRLSA